MSTSLERRAKLIRSRALRRRWEYRQRDTSHGVWFRVGRVLADAAELWAISEDEAERLMAEGFFPDPVGRELEPPKRLLRVSRARLDLIAGRRLIPASLGPEFLAARSVALVCFTSEDR